MRLQITTPTKTYEFAARNGASNIVIGNRDRDDLTIDAPDVSGPHVRLERFAGDWSFTDQFSGVGTFHNGEKKYSGDLAVGDVLKIGGAEIRVLSLKDAPAPKREPVIYHEHKHTPDDEPHPAPKSKQLGAVIQEPQQPAIREVKPVEAPRDKTSPSTPPPPAFVERITDKLAREFENQHGADISENKEVMQRIEAAAIKAVTELEGVKSTTVDLPYLYANSSGPKHLNVEVHRRHLHEEIEHFEARPKEVKGPNRSAKALSKKQQELRRKLGVVFGVSATALFIVFVTFAEEWFSDSIDDDAVFTAETNGSAEEERARHKAAEAQLAADVVALMKRKDRSPQELMGQLEVYESRAKQAGYNIGWDYERTRTFLSTEVYREVSLRYNDVSGDQYDLRQAHKYREAQQQADDFKEYLDSSIHHQRAITILELDEAVQRWSEGNAKGSEELIAEQLLLIAEATHHSDFPPAVLAMQKIIDGAIVEEPVLANCRELRDLWKQKTEEPQPRFDRRKDKPEDAPENELLPNGDRGAYSNLNKLHRRVGDEIKSGAWDGCEFELWGMAGEINPRPKTSQLIVTYTRELGGGLSISGTHIVMFLNMLPRARLSVLLLDDNATVDDLMAMLIYAFDEGLMDSAGEVAFRIRQAVPEQRENLDEILAVKWEVPVPEEGFPERDGRVVPE